MLPAFAWGRGEFTESRAWGKDLCPGHLIKRQPLGAGKMTQEKGFRYLMKVSGGDHGREGKGLCHKDPLKSIQDVSQTMHRMELGTSAHQLSTFTGQGSSVKPWTSLYGPCGMQQEFMALERPRTKSKVCGPHLRQDRNETGKPHPPPPHRMVHTSHDWKREWANKCVAPQTHKSFSGLEPHPHWWWNSWSLGVSFHKVGIMAPLSHRAAGRRGWAYPLKAYSRCPANRSAHLSASAAALTWKWFFSVLQSASHSWTCLTWFIPQRELLGSKTGCLWGSLRQRVKWRAGWQGR